MSAPTNFNYTVRKQNEFRRQKKLFKKLVTEAEKRVFLANAEWWPLEFWVPNMHDGYRWYPTAVGMPILDDEHPIGFDNPEAAYARCLVLKKEYSEPPPVAAT